MAAGVPNPAYGGGAYALKPLGTAIYETAGTFNGTVPSGTRMIRIQLRGAGGGGAGSIARSGGVVPMQGGGQGALVRKHFEPKSRDYSLVVGVGGAAGPATSTSVGGNGGESTCFGFTAPGGSGGRNQFNYAPTGAQLNGGVGSDGAEPFIGDGFFNGASADGYGVGAGPNGGAGGTSTYVSGRAGALGCGGGGGLYTSSSTGGKGGDGYCYLEFFG